MLTRQVQLYVKNDFVLPDVYSKGTLEEVEEALLVGANIYYSISKLFLYYYN
jgi:hypothetical protein